MKKICLYLFLFIFSISTAISATIKEVVFFGDSLSDNGNLYDILKIFPQSPPYYFGRFTNGPTWAEHLGDYYYKINYANVKNYAYGGATAILHLPLKDHYAVPVFLQSELDDYFTHSAQSDKENTLFVIWIGANDYLDDQTSEIEVLTDQVVNKISDSISSLVSKGGRYFLILNLPDLSQIPFGKANNERLHNFSVMHNQKLQKSINLLKEQYTNSEFVFMDIYFILNDMISNIDLYNTRYKTHISNVTDPCLISNLSRMTLKNKIENMFSQRKVSILNKELHQNEISEMIMNSPSLATAFHVTKQNSAIEETSMICSDSDAYTFWDTVHPTAVVHQMLSQMAVETLEKQNII